MKMEIKYAILLTSSFLSMACVGVELTEEEFMAQQQKEHHANLEAEARNGNKFSCYRLANYYYFGRQFLDDPEKIRSSYYKSDDEKGRIYYKIGKLQVEQEDYEKAYKLYEQAAS